MDISNLKISDLKIIEQLPYVHSIRELSRRLQSDPQNLTKRIKYIEDTIGFALATRSVQGIIVSQLGREASKIAESTLISLQSMTRDAIRPRPNEQKTIRTSGRGFMVDHFISTAIKPLSSEAPELTFDLMDSSPKLTERSARKGLLDFMMSFGDAFPGQNWKTVQSRDVNYFLTVRKDHPLTKQKDIASLKGYPMVGFCYIDAASRLVSIESPIQNQLAASRGCGSENTRYTIALVKHSDSIAYLPDISMLTEIASGALQVIKIKSLPAETKKLHLHFNMDTISQKIMTTLVKVMS